MLGEAGAEARRLTSVYIGGGTPTVLDPGAIGRIIDGIAGAFNPSKTPFGSTTGSIEVTVEANPGTIGAEGLKGLKAAGANRLSIGVQSFNERVLASLGRIHSARKAEEVFCEARLAGFENVGLDLIFGAPGQGLKDWKEDLKKAFSMGPEHIALYGLTIEAGTPFARIYGKGAPAQPQCAPLPCEDLSIEMYKEAVQVLENGGFVHYEISNFAQPGRESVHNTGYWSGREYIGLGAGAHTYLERGDWGARFWNEKDPDEYMRLVEEDGSARVGGEELTKEEAVVERVMLGLRMLNAGVDGKSFSRRFGLSTKEALPGWKALAEEGLVRFSGEDLLLTPKGVVVSDEVFFRLL